MRPALSLCRKNWMPAAIRLVGQAAGLGDQVAQALIAVSERVAARELHLAGERDDALQLPARLLEDQDVVERLEHEGRRA